ncbi:MAG: 1,4-alpha-glucan branching protein GlgB [Kineosporiaceae bacterium]
MSTAALPTTPRAGSLPELLAVWLPKRRWFLGGSDPSLRLTRAGGLLLRDDADGVGVETFLVTAHVGGTATTYQVPLTYRDVPVPELDHALIGVLDDDRRGPRWIYDAPHDPAFVHEWVQLLVDEAEAEAPEGAHLGRVLGTRQPNSAEPDPLAASQVLRGEQSNTSIILARGTGTPAIVKLFRVLQPGDNPEVMIASALAGAGCERVPQTMGWWQATWPGPSDTTVSGQLGVVAEFVGDAEDAWRVACRAVDEGRSFAEEARALGRATAEVHAALARSLPTVPADAGQMRRIASSLQGRVTWAAGQAPVLAAVADAAEAVVTQVREVRTAGMLQQIHGDYHLGQVLHSPSRGWLLLDFEGEPLRPLPERTAPDLPLRDVAGMLRSFDYAAVHALARGRGSADAPSTASDPATGQAATVQADQARGWAEEARAAFLSGYSAASGEDPLADDRLLQALELDKALYEVVYETRHRPDWVEVPLAALHRLLPHAPWPGTVAGAPPPGDGPPPGPTDPVPPRAEDVPMTDQSTTVTSDVAVTQTPSPAGTSSDTLAGPATPVDPASLVAASGVDPAEVLPVDPDVFAKLSGGAWHDPHSVLGAHRYDGGVVVRVLRPFATRVAVQLEDGSEHEAAHEYDGIFTAVLPGRTVGDYRLRVSYEGVGEVVVDDPYRFLPTLGELDIHLIREGRHEELWTVLGAHVRHFGGVISPVSGVSFAVWAPNAQAVRLVGDFNHWNGREHAMRSLGSSGVWELFVPGLGAGARYKFEILGRDGHWRQKADPMAFGTEVPPATASVVVESDYTWGDDAWLATRAGSDPHHSPMSVYEVHLGSWRQGLSYRDLADQLVGYVKDMGFTHVELMPVAEHPFGGSWGYQVTSYYAPTSRFGHPDDFRHLVDTLHQAGIGVIVDWVPAHFPKDEWALAKFDGQPLYEYADPRKGEHPDWGTLVFDYGRTEVRNFLVANALYWLEEFHIDGLRVDAVASMLYLDYSRKDGQWAPNIYGGREHLEAIGFLQEMNATAYRRVPGVVTIAEESTAWPGVTRPTHLGGLGFGLKWNMGWMHDSLLYMSKEPVYRQYHHHQLTFSMVYAYSENFVLPISHDEVVHGKGSLLRKMPGDRWQQLANMRAYLAFMWAHPGKQLLFMGQELGQEAEWNESTSLDWWLEETPWHAGLQQLVRDLNRIYRDDSALWSLDSDPAGFQWIDANDAGHNTFSFVRLDRDGRELLCVSNFAAVPHEGYRIGLPRPGRWRELLNTDAEAYAGSGVGNAGEVSSEPVPWHGREHSAVLRVPPLATVWLEPAD